MAAHVQRRHGKGVPYQPLLILVVALAAGELRAALELDGQPRLEVVGPMLCLLLMEIKSSIQGEAAQK